MFYCGLPSPPFMHGEAAEAMPMPFLCVEQPGSCPAGTTQRPPGFESTALQHMPAHTRASTPATALPAQMILPVALGFAAGCMIWMVFAELLPDAMEQAEAAQVGTARGPVGTVHQWRATPPSASARLRAELNIYLPTAHSPCRWPPPPRCRLPAWRPSACCLPPWSSLTAPLAAARQR